MMNYQCGIIPVAAIAVFALLIFAVGMKGQAGALPDHIVPDKDRVRIITVFTMEGCGPCEKLQAYMKKHGIRLTDPPVETREMPLVPAGFPAVYYQLGNGKYAWDNGERIYKHQYWLPAKAVERVHYIPN